MPEFAHLQIELPDELVGDRIVLRPLREADAEVYFDLVDRSREHLSRWIIPPGRFTSIDEVRALLCRFAGLWLLREEFRMGIFASQGELIGHIGLYPRNWDIPSFEIGYWLGAPYEGHGYMTEAVCLATQLAIEHLGANRVTIRCARENPRSAAVARRCGYVREGTLRNDYVVAPKILTDTLFAMTPAEYAVAHRQWAGSERP